MKPYVTDAKERTKRDILLFCFGLVTGMFIVLLAQDYKAAADEQVLIKACRLPDMNGAMTVFVMENDYLKCWRWR
jgi:hypothetical protein